MQTPPAPPSPEEPVQPSRRNPLYGPAGVLAISLLAIFSLLLLAGALLLDTVAAPQSATSTVSPFPTFPPSPTAPPTATASITPSPLPTLTPSPFPSATASNTPTRTTTSTSPATLTPAAPDASIRFYGLADTSPRIFSDGLARLEYLAARQPTLAAKVSGDRLALAYSPAALLAADAVRRYPEVATNLSWQINLARNLARMDSPASVDVFATVIEQALESGQISLEEIPAWFNLHTFSYIVTLTPFEEAGGTAYLAEITGPGDGFVLLRRAEAGYTVTPLISGLSEPHPQLYTALLHDLTGDGNPEAIFWPQPDSLRDTLKPPVVIDLSSSPVTTLPYQPWERLRLGLEGDLTWSPGSTPGSVDFTAVLYPGCPVTIRSGYRWEDGLLLPMPVRYQITPIEGEPGLCSILIEHAMHFWGPEASVSVLEQLLPYWPPERYADGSLAPLDAADELRLQLGMSYAILGDADKAAEVLNSLMQQPSIPASRYAPLGAQFLDDFTAPQRLYAACVRVPDCDVRQALAQTVAISGLPNALTSGPQLASLGVDYRATGTLDADGDGRVERWVTVRHRDGDRLEAWLIAATPFGPRAFLIDEIDDPYPDFYPFAIPGGGQLTWMNNQAAFQLYRSDDGQQIGFERQSLVFWYDQLTKAVLEETLSAWLAGAPPSELRDRLYEWQRQEEFTCITDDNLCARMTAQLAIFAEAAGDPEFAVEQYWKLWRTAPNPAYITLARLRLQRDPTAPTQTPSPTPTRTPTRTPFRNPSITPRPTRTNTPTSSPTLTPTPSVTPSPTPTPSNTPPTPYP